MPSPSISDQLKQVGGEAACADLCATGRQLKNVGRVRMRVMINDYCPFYGMRKQDETFQFDSNTFSALPRSIQSRVRMHGEGVDGITLRENFILRSNLMFVSGKTDDKSTSTNVKDKVVAPEHAVVQTIWDNGTFKSKQDHEYVPHYAWTHTGSLFTHDVIQPDEYRVAASPTISQSSGSSTTPKVNLAKWDYKTVNTPVNTQFAVTQGGTQVAGTSSQPNILFPMQGVTGTVSETRGMHWAVEKRRPVFQGADFFVIIHRIASESTIQTASLPLLDKYKPLDSRLTNATGANGVLINGGVVETNEGGGIIDDSRNIFDFNNQVYLILEIGQEDPDHNYFLILAEKTFPTLINVGTAPVAVKKPTGGIDVIVPDEPVSRRIATYEGAMSSELLGQPELVVVVKNYMGRLLITFSGHEDNPWVIERKDLITQQQAQQGTTNGTVDPYQYVESIVPIVVPPAKLALYGGNVKVAFNWGFLKFEPEVNIRMPQTVHIEGTRNALPSYGDIQLRLRGLDKADRVASTTNDSIYHHDALKFGETVNGSLIYFAANSTSQSGQAQTYALYGKGRVPPNNSKSGSGTFRWPVQTQATPLADMSSISVTAENLRAINGEDRAKEFEVFVKLRAGHFTYASDPENTVQKPTQFINVISPICSGYKLRVDARGCAFRSVGRDVSHHALSFQETWSAQDYVRVEHSGTIKLLISDGMEPVVAPVVRYSNGQGTGLNPFPPVSPAPNESDFIASLADKRFYIRIQAWYEQSGVFPLSALNDNAYIFTGICTGTKIIYENNYTVLECHLCDLMDSLQGQFFMNSPYYDAVRDFVAVKDIMQQATFHSGDTGGCAGNVYPAQVLSRAVRQSSVQDVFDVVYKSGNASGVIPEIVRCRGFALPGAYDRLANPVFRFKDGEKLVDAISRMANVAGKQVYFDRFGVFHYEDRIDTLLTARLLSEQQVVSSPNIVKERFYASPRVKGCNGHGQLAYNSYTWQRLMGDVINQIMVVSASPDGSLLVGGDKEYDLIDNPSAPGFIGYPKQFLQMSGVFGSEEAVRNAVENYTTMYKPPLQVSFEAFGRSYLKALDIITFTGIDEKNNNLGLEQPLRVMNISTEITPGKNTWWSRIDGEWLFPGDGVDWGN